MSAKCAICHRAFVSEPGQICLSCRLRQQEDERKTNSDMNRYNTFNTANPFQTVDNVHITDAITMTEKMGDAGTVQQMNLQEQENGCYIGIVQNVHENNMQKSFVRRWCDALFYGTPLTSGDVQYEFSLYSKGIQTAEYASGHEVVFYGNPGYSFLNNNSTVRVYGQKDRNGVIAASKIEVVNTGFRMRAKGYVPAVVIRLITLLAVLGLLFLVASLLGWGAEMKEKVSTRDVGAVMETAESEVSAGKPWLFTMLCTVVGGIITRFKSWRWTKRWGFAALIFSVGLIPFSILPCLGVVMIMLLYKVITGR